MAGTASGLTAKATSVVFGQTSVRKIFVSFPQGA